MLRHEVETEGHANTTGRETVSLPIVPPLPDVRSPVEARMPVATPLDHEEWQQVLHLRNRLRPIHPLRRISLHPLEPVMLSPDEYHEVTRTLHTASPARWRERSLAAHILGQAALTEEEAEEAARTLCNLLHDTLPAPRKIQSRLFARAAGVCALLGAIPTALILLLLFVPEISEAGLPGPGMLTFQIAVLLAMWGMFSLMAAGLILPFLSAYWARAAHQPRVFAVRALCRLLRPMSAGTLASFARHPDARLAIPALSGLRTLLPRLTADDYGRVPAYVAPELCRLLNFRISLAGNPDRAELEYELLAAVGKIGGGGALETVRRLAAQGCTPDIRVLATNLLPILEERRQMEQQSDILLRPAHDPGPPPDQLLRPASGRNYASPDELLRPTRPEDDRV